MHGCTDGRVDSDRPCVEQFTTPCPHTAEEEARVSLCCVLGLGSRAGLWPGLRAWPPPVPAVELGARWPTRGPLQSPV